MMPVLKNIGLLSPLKQFHEYVVGAGEMSFNIALPWMCINMDVRAVSVNGCSANQVGFTPFVGWVTRGRWFLYLIQSHLSFLQLDRIIALWKRVLFIWCEMIFMNIFLIHLCQENILPKTLIIWGYDLYYYLTYPIKWMFFELESCTGAHYFMLNFYQIEWEWWDSIP